MREREREGRRERENFLKIMIVIVMAEGRAFSTPSSVCWCSESTDRRWQSHLILKMLMFSILHSQCPRLGINATVIKIQK